MSDARPPLAPSANRLTPMGFVMAFGVVSMLADFVYEGARSIVGPYLATFGANAAVVGLVTGAGEAVALMLRLVTGPLSDRTRKYWPISIAGYVITVVAVPLLGAVTATWQAITGVIAERFGKAVRTPARDTMLGHASSSVGRGRAFALHEALDQSGAMLGPLLVAGMVALSGYRLGFAILAVPGALSLVALAWLRRAVPTPEAYDAAVATAPVASSRVEPWWRFSARYWAYSAFTALSMLGFATFGVLAYHADVAHVLPVWQIPVLYAAAMGVDAIGALLSGWLYDRVGLRGLVAVPVLTAILPFLAFSSRADLVWAGGLLWGLAFGIHESTMRAAVTDLVPGHRRGTGYGTFTAVYGLAWLVGGSVIGALYDTSRTGLHVFVVVTQVAALAVFLPLASRERRRDRVSG